MFITIFHDIFILENIYEKEKNKYSCKFPLPKLLRFLVLVLDMEEIFYYGMLHKEIICDRIPFEKNQDVQLLICVIHGSRSSGNLHATSY